jgi:hypothetical protein
MPIHDWTRVDANLFHHFHQAWTIRICNALNGGVLPRGFSALVERHGTGVVLQAQDELLSSRGNRITIRHPLGEIVSVIEVVSPGNKTSRSSLRAFVDKTVDFLRRGVHLLVVDLFPPTKRDPQGIHKVIWDEFQDEPFALPPDKPLTLAAYVAGVPKTAYVEFVGVGDLLPDMPAYLDVDSYVRVPLEASYRSAWASCPDDMQEFVERAASAPSPSGRGPG